MALSTRLEKWGPAPGKGQGGVEVEVEVGSMWPRYSRVKVAVCRLTVHMSAQLDTGTTQNPNTEVGRARKVERGGLT